MPTKKSEIDVLHVASSMEKDSVKRYTEMLRNEVARTKNGSITQDIFYINKVRPFRSYLSLTSAIRERKVKVLHIQHEYGLFDNYFALTFLLYYPFLVLASRLNRTKIVISWHTMPDRKEMDSIGYPQFIKGSGFFMNLAKWYFILSIRPVGNLADMNIVLTDFARKTAINFYHLRKDKVIFIPAALDIGRKLKFTKQSKLAFITKNRLSGKKIISLVGFAFKLKSYERVIHCMPHILKLDKNVRLVITGGVISGPGKEYLDSLKALAAEYGIEKEVIFTDYLSEEDLNVLLGITDLFVFPYSYKVGDSAAVNLAMNTGKPIIVSNIPAFKELIDEKLVQKDDMESTVELSKKIVDTMENSSKHTSTKKKIEKYFENNGIGRMTEMHAEVYFGLIKKAQSEV